MATPFEISERYTEAWADLAPSTATTAGISGRHHLNTDLSPDGYAARNDLNRRTLAELRAAAVSDETDAFAVTVLAGNLEESIALYEAGKWTRDLNHIFSPFQRVRDAFDVTPKETSEDWEAIVSRLSGFTRSLEGYQQSLAIGVGEGDTVARRQVESVISQAEAAGSASSRFVALVDHARSAGVDPDRVEAAAEKARQGCNDLADWLRDNYLPVATSRDAVGAERYQEGTNRFLGMSIDLDETYEWGWSEVHRIRSEMTQASHEIDDSLSLGEVIHLLDNDRQLPARILPSSFLRSNVKPSISLHALTSTSRPRFEKCRSTSHHPVAVLALGMSARLRTSRGRDRFGTHRGNGAVCRIGRKCLRPITKASLAIIYK